MKSEQANVDPLMTLLKYKASVMGTPAVLIGDQSNDSSTGVVDVSRTREVQAAIELLINRLPETSRTFFTRAKVFCMLCPMNGSAASERAS